MRSNSESFATKCFTEQPTPVDCTPRMYSTASHSGQVRVFGVALEVPAGQRMAMDVDGRREQHVRTLAAGLAPDALTDGAHELGAPGGAERGSARKRCRRAARPSLPAHAGRAVGDLERRDAESRHGSRVPEIDSRDHHRLLFDREVAEELADS